MKYIQKTESYNERRYGKPWIATVIFDSASKAVFIFGNWVGDNGYSGLLELDVSPGEIVAVGQKDTRKPANSAPAFYIMQDSGKLGEQISKKDAYLHYRDNQPVMPSRDELLAKKAELIAQLELIETMLNATTNQRRNENV